MTVIDDGVEFEVIWEGGELLPGREQRPDPTWQAPTQQANKNRKLIVEFESDGDNNE